MLTGLRPLGFYFEKPSFWSPLLSSEAFPGRDSRLAEGAKKQQAHGLFGLFELDLKHSFIALRVGFTSVAGLLLQAASGGQFGSVSLK